MINPRLLLDQEFRSICLEEIGEENVYFSAPDKSSMSIENGFMQLRYPCILYSLSNATTLYADNKKYILRKRYVVTVIDENPDSSLRDRMILFPMCTFDRSYVAEGLNHYVFTLYY